MASPSIGGSAVRDTAVGLQSVLNVSSGYAAGLSSSRGPPLADGHQDNLGGRSMQKPVEELGGRELLDRLYRLQEELLLHQEDQELSRGHLEGEVRFVLGSMGQFLDNGLFQIISLNLLYKVLAREPPLAELMVHLGVLPLLGRLLEAQRPNDLVQEGAKRLLKLLADDPEQGEKAGQAASGSRGLGPEEQLPPERKFLPYRMNRMNQAYMRHVIGQPPPTESAQASQLPPSRPTSAPTIDLPGHHELLTSPTRGESAATRPRTVAVQQPGPSSSSPTRLPRDHSRGMTAPAKTEGRGRTAGRRRKRRRAQLPACAEGEEQAPAFPHRTPLEVSRHPTVHKIFARRLPRRFSPLQDMLLLFQVLDDDNSGLITAGKFEQALGCLGLELSPAEVHRMLQDFGVKRGDLIDYELFCTSGKIIGAKILPAPAGLPVKPWIKRTKHFEAEKAGTTTWTGHKEWCRRRRAKAAVWLMRRGLKAKQLIRVRAATHLILLQYAKKAFAVSYLRQRVKAARDHVERQKKCLRWLQWRIAHARKVKTKHAEAFRFLVKRGQLAFDLMPRREIKVGTVNYQSVYRLRWLHDKAFAYLRTLGAAAVARVNLTIAHRRRQKEEFKELREFAKRALANQELRIESKYKREQADKVATEVTAAVKKEKEAWDRKEKALRWLLDRALRACEHVKAVVHCQAFLQAKAERALRAWAAREEALANLLERRPHAFVTQTNKAQAILFCLERAQATFIFLAAKDEACDWLRQRSETAGRCLRGHREAFDFLSSMAQACIERELARASARRFLLKIAKVAVEHTKLKAKAAFELKRIIDDIRIEMYRATMSAMYKDVIAKVKSDLRTEDRERADQWREMSSEQVFDAKLREAFNLYDVDHTGEINRLDFRYLVENLNLVAKMSKEDFDQFFDMVDKDGSGKIDFQEFSSWMVFEMSRTGAVVASGSNSSRAQQLLSKPSLLPRDERALLTVMSMVKKGQVVEREPGQQALAYVDVNSVVNGIASLRPNTTAASSSGNTVATETSSLTSSSGGSSMRSLQASTIKSLNNDMSSSKRGGPDKVEEPQEQDKGQGEGEQASGNKSVSGWLKNKIGR